jgi:hypothetical protein
MKEYRTIQMRGYSIKNLIFQTRPGIFATANLYIPDGKGPFPAVINMLGHWRKGKIDSTGPQAVGHTLAANGYVCLTLDPWGSGERTTVHGIFEDHGDGNNLGSALLNLGESLLGITISDNIRGVDLLYSLPYVNSGKIGATGASGGGNQTMWLAALDERIKAAVPVVSVGTFQSYIMGTPCICEVMTDALTFMEESGVLAMIAPRAVMPCNHKKDANPAFFPSEMMRSYQNAKPIFRMLGVEENLSYHIFDLSHGYMKADREAMLGWFDLHLKGIGPGTPRNEIPFVQLPEEELMVFQKGLRETGVITTDEYCIKRGIELRNSFLNTGSFDLKIKRNDLREILKVDERSSVTEIHKYSAIGGWNRLAIETSDSKMIPLLLHAPPGNSTDFLIICDPEGKRSIPEELITESLRSGKGIAIVDLSGTGESSFNLSRMNYFNGKLRVMSRSELWLGKRVLGEWVEELNLVNRFLRDQYKSEKIDIDGSKEAGLAALFMCAIYNNTDQLFLREVPVSYQFDNRDSIDFYSSGIFLPGILQWGDVSLVASMTGKNITFINPLTLSGRKISVSMLQEYSAEFEKIRKICKQPGKTLLKSTTNSI